MASSSKGAQGDPDEGDEPSAISAQIADLNNASKRRRDRGVALCCAISVALAACSQPGHEPFDAAAVDTRLGADATRPDASRTNDAAGAVDAIGSRDAASVDAYMIDAHPVDGRGNVDASSIDGGNPVGCIERASVSVSGGDANGESDLPSLAGDGRYVVFASGATNLLAGGNAAGNTIVRDRLTGTTEIASLTVSGAPQDMWSYTGVTSAGGSVVVFVSPSTNLVPGDTNGFDDVFVRDRAAGTTELVSVATNGTRGNGDSGWRSFAISPDGRYVVFESKASNLVAGDTNGVPDLFLRDRTTEATTRVSLAFDGSQANDETFDPALSEDGRFVVFVSTATNLVPGNTGGYEYVFVRDRLLGTTQTVAPGGGPVRISDDGRYVAFVGAAGLVPGDTNNRADVFVRDQQAGTIERVSVSSSGGQGNDESIYPAMSADGRYVAFLSSASNLVPGDTNGLDDVFVHDRQTGETRRLDVSCQGAEANDVVYPPSISRDGRYLAFGSVASNLVPNDMNAREDAFVAPNPLAPW